MKKHLFAISFIALLCSLAVFFSVVGSVKADGSVEINSTNFPDSVFREYVKKKDKDGNGILSSQELDDFTNILFRDSALTNIKGYELLPNLRSIYIYNCDNITALEVRSARTDFNYLEIENCDNLKTLVVDIPNANGFICRLYADFALSTAEFTCKHFDRLQFFTAQNITKLDLSHVGSMGALTLNSSKIKTLDLSPIASSLESLELNLNKELSSLDVSKCTNLERLDVSDTALTKLNIKNNTSLSYYDCSNTAIREASVYYAPRLNQALSVGEKREVDNNLEWKYRCNTFLTYTIKAPKDALVWGKALSSTETNKIKDPLLNDYTSYFYDYDKDRYFNDSEIFEVQEIILDSWRDMHKITTLEDMSIFTNLKTFITSGVDYDVADLGYLHCQRVAVSHCDIGKLIIPDNIQIDDLGLYQYKYGFDNLYLGHQKQLRRFDCSSNVIQSDPLKVVDISDCPNLIDAYLTGTKEVIKEKYSNAETNYKYSTPDGKMIYVPQCVRVKYGKDILVTALNGSVKGAGEHKAGEKVTLTAVPDNGYLSIKYFI